MDQCLWFPLLCKDKLVQAWKIRYSMQLTMFLSRIDHRFGEKHGKSHRL
jgi:hypothetical protein